LIRTPRPAPVTTRRAAAQGNLAEARRDPSRPAVIPTARTTRKAGRGTVASRSSSTRAA